MPEAKNTFLKSRMNQDLDDRLLPQGEYREAVNILVGKSENNNVGVIENILGNKVVADFTNTYKHIIGVFMDQTHEQIYVFLTDNELDGNCTINNNCAIALYDVNTKQHQILVSGYFLNFSTQYNILSVSLLEDLLFWTDNFNQPRRINVFKAKNNTNYYTNENQISVATYNPYKPISLITKITGIITNVNTVDKKITIDKCVEPEVGMLVSIYNGTHKSTIIGFNDYYIVKTIENNTYESIPGLYNITLSYIDDSTAELPITPADVTDGCTINFIKSGMTNEKYNTNWPGDPVYLENKFVRFSYRYKYDNNEYSILAPFTQIAFVPKQNGFFFNGDENSAVASTVVNFMENEINNIYLNIELPCEGAKLEDEYKIKSIDILYKESDSTNIKILDTINVNSIIDNTSNTNIFTYNYQSRKPIKTLPDNQLIRVSDIVPIKAKAQDISGNRIIYGNIQLKQKAPTHIDYNISVSEKYKNANATNLIEYPNHTLKQNRNYQVGFVLSDKYGRQSSVILSTVDINKPDEYSNGSTIYSPYIIGTTDTSVKDWIGNSLILQLNEQICVDDYSENLYAKPNGGFIIGPNSYTYIEDDKYKYQLRYASGDIPKVGDYLRGKYNDYVLIKSITIVPTVYIYELDGEISDIYTCGNDPVNIINYSYTINQTGWYSYKIVVKQVEQEYYNMYLPAPIIPISNNIGTSDWIDGLYGVTNNKIAFLTLINDNINKLPRDLNEVGPDQKIYRSSVKLYPRVALVSEEIPGEIPSEIYYNKYINQGKLFDISTNISNLSQLKLNTDNDKYSYQYTSDPIIANIHTYNQIGITYDKLIVGTINNINQLIVYETDPFISTLDIYWETTETGLISDINLDIINSELSSDKPLGLSPVIFKLGDSNLFSETNEIGDIISNEFFIYKAGNTPLESDHCDIYKITDKDNNNITSLDLFVIDKAPESTTNYLLKLNKKIEYTKSIAGKFPLTIWVESSKESTWIRKDKFTINLSDFVNVQPWLNYVNTNPITINWKDAPALISSPFEFNNGAGDTYKSGVIFSIYKVTLVDDHNYETEVQYSDWSQWFEVNELDGKIYTKVTTTPPTPELIYKIYIHIIDAADVNGHINTSLQFDDAFIEIKPTIKRKKYSFTINPEDYNSGEMYPNVEYFIDSVIDPDGNIIRNTFISQTHVSYDNSTPRPIIWDLLIVNGDILKVPNTGRLEKVNGDGSNYIDYTSFVYIGYES